MNTNTSTAPEQIDPAAVFGCASSLWEACQKSAENDRLSKADIRWMQRLQNYRQALSRLTEAVRLSEKRPLSDLEQQGLIQGFEYTHELAWNVLKDYLEAQGFVGIIGSKGATREAFKNGLITEGEAWMDMIKARHLTSHTYQTKVAEDIVKDILGRFQPALVALERRLMDLEKKETDGV